MILRFFLSSLIATSAFADIIEKPVDYRQGDTALEGYHAYDDSISGPRPAILIVHQWTGLSNYEKSRSKMLAKLGYNVFALDIYGKGIRPQPPESGQQAGKYKNDRALFRERLNAGLEVLIKDKRTDPGKIAAIGYCFGGTGALELARSGAEIAGVVSFHGGLGAADGQAAKGETLKARILVCHGADDPHVPDAEIAGFATEMRAAGADWQLIAYGNSVHAFTQKMAGNDNSKGVAYNELADQRSWNAMRQFFDEIFK